MLKFVFVIYNYATKKFEEECYTAESMAEALDKLWDDHDKDVHVIEDWYAL